MPKVFTANRCYNSTFPPSHLFPGNGYKAVFLTRKIAIYILVVFTCSRISPFFIHCPFISMRLYGTLTKENRGGGGLQNDTVFRK